MATRQLSTKQVVNLASDPNSGTPGEIYYNTVSNSFKYYNGTSWVAFSSGGGGNSFETIDVPNGTDPVADSAADTLIFIESNGIIITGDSSADSIQFSTNATASNTASTIVSRDSDQSFDITAVDFDTTDTITSAVGRLAWDDGEGTLSFGVKGGNLNLEIGQENIALCYNGTGSEITKGSVVYISGAQGQRPSVSLADADTEVTSSKTFGIVAENIANGAEGFIATFGVVPGLNTSGFTAGQALWLSSTAGQLTNIKPSAPTHAVFIGYCLSVNSSSGRIFVNPQNGYEIDELHNVSISSIADNHILSYDNATSLWKNQGLAAAIQEVDGPSSGIDADLLDGQHGFYYAPINSPALTGTPTAPTAAAATNTTQIATTEFVRTEISNLVDSAPATLDTLNELAAALGDDPNFATTVTNSLSLKAPLANPTFTGVVILPTSATSGASIRIPHGTAPTAPTNGDIWTTTSGLYARISDATVGPFGQGNQYYQTTAPSFPAVGDIWIDSDEALSSLSSNDFALKNSPIFTGTVVLPTSSSSGASTRIPHGTAPSSPVNGDIWTTTSGLFARINGATQQYAPVSGNLSQFASTTSAQLAGIISDETGSGSLVFSISPILTTPNIGAATGTSLNLTGFIRANAESYIDVLGNQLLLHAGTTSHPTVIHRNDSSNYYILLSAAQTTPSGTWNTLRPFYINLTSGLVTMNNGLTLGGRLNSAASTVSGSGLNIPHGTAPSSPTNGDIWTTTAGIFARINGTTEQLNAQPLSPFLLGGM